MSGQVHCNSSPVICDMLAENLEKLKCTKEELINSKVGRGGCPSKKNLDRLRPHWTHCATVVIRYPLVTKPLGAPDEAI